MNIFKILIGFFLIKFLIGINKFFLQKFLKQDKLYIKELKPPYIPSGDKVISFENMERLSLLGKNVASEINVTLF